MKNSFTLSQEITQKVSAYIDSHEEEILADFKDLLRIPSFRGEEEPDAPFGRACAEAVEFSARLLQKDEAILSASVKIQQGEADAVEVPSDDKVLENEAGYLSQTDLETIVRRLQESGFLHNFKFKKCGGVIYRSHIVEVLLAFEHRYHH